MTVSARFVHVNLIAQDWKTLARFYERVFGCALIPPERRLAAATAANRPGFAHIAFAVDDVAAARDAVLAAGGGSVGEVTSVEISGAGSITFAYVTDPEGNIVELQRWA